VADRSIHELQRQQNARSPTVRHRICDTISLWVADDRWRCCQRPSAGLLQSTPVRCDCDSERRVYGQSEFDTLWGTQPMQVLEQSGGDWFKSYSRTSTALLALWTLNLLYQLYYEYEYQRVRSSGWSFFVLYKADLLKLVTEQRPKLDPSHTRRWHSVYGSCPSDGAAALQDQVTECIDAVGCVDSIQSTTTKPRF